ncbi:MAG: methyl-accepting chemotaxis protein [Desulfobacteraceae bacterium]|nr:methyl-accepting chemotaxis protein [Desulfobacteraceae bacterium]
MGLKRVGTKLNVLIAVMLLLTCVIVTSVSYRIGRSCMGKMLQTIHMPAVMENISAVVDRNLLNPAEGLALVAENSFLTRWIMDGEPSGDVETVYALLQGVTSHYSTNGANVVLWDTQNYYDLHDSNRTLKKLSAQDTWFKAFKDSGERVSINVYINDKVYGSTAFINRRIEKNGRFLGLTSVSLNLDAFIKSVTDTAVGERGETYMVDKKGLVQMHKNQAWLQALNLGDKPGWAGHVKEVLSKEQASFTMTDGNGETIIVMTRYVPSLGWYLVAEANETELIETVSNELFEDMNGALFAIILASLLLLAAGVGVCLFFSSRTITKPINETVNRIKDIATGEGDLTMRLPVTSNDEIGELAFWLNTFMEKLQGIVSNISASAKNVSTSSGDLLSIASDLVTETMETSEKVVTVATATDQASSNIGAIAVTIGENSAKTAMVAEAADQMSATIQGVAATSDNARQMTESAVVKAEKALEKMERLGDAAGKIGQVTQTINEISEQTNLLSLNATIEAARAGEAGKGFAVVANEIKELARQTAHATDDIKTRIQGIQDTTETSVGEIAEISTAIKEVSAMVKNIDTSIDEQSSVTNEIATNIGQVAGGIDDVTENVNQSSDAASRISSDINGVNASTRRMSNSGGEVKNSAEQLRELADKLQDAVGSFKI